MRLIVFLAGVAMAASFGLTWVEMPFAGPDISPVSAWRDGLISIGPDEPWQVYVFLAGFALAIAAAVTRAGGVALLAGVTPVVVVVSLIGQLDQIRRDLGLPFEIDWSDLSATLDVLGDFARLGLWAYLGGAAILMIAGLAMLTGERR